MQLIEMPTTKKSSSQIAQKADVPKTKKIRYIRNVEKLENIPDDVKEDLKKSCRKICLPRKRLLSRFDRLE